MKLLINSQLDIRVHIIFFFKSKLTYTHNLVVLILCKNDGWTIIRWARGKKKVVVIILKLGSNLQIVHKQIDEFRCNKVVIGILNVSFVDKRAFAEWKHLVGRNAYIEKINVVRE